jgi:signal transduction histidine kinase
MQTSGVFMRTRMNGSQQDRAIDGPSRVAARDGRLPRGRRYRVCHRDAMSKLRLSIINERKGNPYGSLGQAKRFGGTVKRSAEAGRVSPTAALLFGLIVTLATVLVYSWYIIGQVSSLQRLQADLTDRNRMASLQLLRIQSDLNQLALAVRDMLDADERTPLASWQGQFDRIRVDFEDAVGREAQVSVSRTEEQTQALRTAVAEVWETVDRVFAFARSGRPGEARGEIRGPLQARLAVLGNAVGQLLLRNNETEARAAQQTQDIYRRVQRQVYWFLSIVLVAIAGTSLYLIDSNQRLFARLAALANERRELARTLISTRESTLREIARELHDGFGQLLTAMGAMLRRAERQAPESSTLRTDLREVAEVAQTALDNVRTLSQTLHPSILDELGLESTIHAYLSTAEKQLGIPVSYERTGTAVPVDATVAIHVYRVLQEAMNNVARHAEARSARITLRFETGALELDVADDGRGIGASERKGLGLVAMRERAELLGGTIAFLKPDSGGTLVRLQVPLPYRAGADASAVPA